MVSVIGERPRRVDEFYCFGYAWHGAVLQTGL